LPRHTFTEGRPSEPVVHYEGAIRRDHLRAAMAEVFGGGGRTIPEIGGAAASGRGALRDEPVWHARREFLEPVAERLHLHPSLWGEARKSSDFYNAVDQELAKLRKKGALADWKRGSGVFRLAKELPPGWADLSDPGAAPDLPGMDDTFMAILRRGGKANTYKFALARAILDHCRENARADPGALEIPYRYLASRFLRYYWHQECKFRIKQDFKTKSDPKVIYAIREVFSDNTPGDFAKLDRTDVEKAEAKILRTVFGHAKSKTSLVVPRFQNVRHRSGAVRTDMFYGYDDDEQKIWLKPEAFSFFKDNYNVLSSAVLAEWAKFLERINSVPMLVAKLERYDAGRGNLATYRRLYLDHTRHCFYCQGRLEKGRIDVDHLIPWSYMFEDDPWNLVLSCRDCNCKKSDSLPQEEFLEGLVSRNRRCYGSIPELRRSLDMLDAGRGWQPEIRGHYEGCREYGFLVQRLP